MTQEQEPLEKQEARVWDLRNRIIARLKERGGDPTARVQGMGYETVRVASNENR